MYDNGLFLYVCTYQLRKTTKTMISTVKIKTKDNSACHYWYYELVVCGFTLSSFNKENQFINFCNSIAIENGDLGIIKTVDQGLSYINNYCDNLTLND